MGIVTNHVLTSHDVFRLKLDRDRSWLTLPGACNPVVQPPTSSEGHTCVGCIYHQSSAFNPINEVPIAVASRKLALIAKLSFSLSGFAWCFNQSRCLLAKELCLNGALQYVAC